MAVSHKTTHGVGVPYGPQSHSWALAPENEKLFSPKHRSVNVYNSFICSSPELETTQVLFSIVIVEQTAEYRHTGMILGDKRTHLTHRTVWMNLQGITRSGKSHPPKSTYCMIPFI